MNDQLDYYQILGVLRTATLDEITAAYYALAQKYHPDVGHQIPAHADQFRQINEAYSALSDQSKRTSYDQQLSKRPPRRAVVSFFGNVWDVRARSNVSDTSRNSSSEETHVEVPITPEEAALGGPCEFKITIPVSCGHCNGTGQRDGYCEGCNGKGSKRLERFVTLRLPSGTPSGTTIRLSGQSKPLGSDRFGDLVVRVMIKPCW